MWNTIIGHKRQIETLKKTLAEGRLPNAWLFSGIRGIGKRLVADVLSAAICCDGLRGGLGFPSTAPLDQRRKAQPALHDVTPCGQCNGCKKVFARSHPDVFIVEPEKQRVLIDQVRDLNQKIQYHPLESKAKIAIIDDADAMTEGAANSLLKVLEEPPTATHFVLITAAAHRILPTIRSRCQKIAFSPLADDEIARYLQTVEEFSPDAAGRAAKYAQGSLGVARELDAPFIDDVVGRFEALSAKANAADRHGASAADIIATSESWASDGERIPLVLDILVSWFRERLREAALHGNEERDARRISDHHTRRISDRLEMVIRARDLAETTANKQLMFEQLLFSVTG